MIIQQVSVFLENKSGRLTDVTAKLSAGSINLVALTIAETSDYGVVRMIVSNPDGAVKALKEEGFAVSLTEVLCLSVPNQPGALHRTLKILSDADISIEYLYAFSLDEKALAVIRCENISKAIDVLTDHKMELIKASKLYSI